MRCTALILTAWALLSGPALAEPFRLIITDMEPALVPNSVIDIALSEGYFTRAGVEVELVRVQQTPMALAALQSGEGEMANVATEGLVRLASMGNRSVRAVMSPNKTLPYLIAGREGMTLEGLKGQAFGIGRIGSLDQMLAHNVLSSKGLSSDDVQMLALGQPGIRAQALAAGQIAATTLSLGSWMALPDHERLPVLVTVEEYFAAAPVVTKVNAVPVPVLETRGAEVEAVIEALTLAARDMAASDTAWAEVMAKLRPDVAPETLAALSRAFRTSWSVNGGLHAQELQITSDWLYQDEAFAAAPRVSPQDWADFGPLQRVLAKIGTAPGSDQPQ